MFSSKETDILPEYFDIILINKKSIKKFDAEMLDFTVKFKNIPEEFVSSLKMMETVMTSIVKTILVNTKPMDTVKMYIDHEVLKDNVQFKFTKANEISSEYIINCLTKLAQSGKILTLDDKLKFHVLIIHQLEGGGVKRLGHFLLKKQCVVRILRNKFDNLCGLRAVIVGKSIADKSDNYDIIRDSRNNLQNQLAIQLAKKLGFSISNSLVIEDLIKVEKYL